MDHRSLPNAPNTKGLIMTRVHKHPDYPNLSPLSQRGHDLLDLFVLWYVDELNEVWDVGSLAKRTAQYFSLCCVVDFKVLMVHSETKILIKNALEDDELNYDSFEKLAKAIDEHKLNEEIVRAVVNEGFQNLSDRQQQTTTECMIMRQNTDKEVQTLFTADWIEMTGNVIDQAVIPTNSLDFELKNMTQSIPYSPEKFQRVLNKKDFYEWRLRLIKEFADVYVALDKMVVKNREITREFSEWKVKKHDDKKEEGFQHDA